MTSFTPFPDLNDVLWQLSAGLQRVLGPELVALYLTGSFALGDADEGSDVDFLAVTREGLTPVQVEAVRAMHRTIFDLPSPWAQHLEGSYFPAELLRSPDPASTPIPYLSHGSHDLEYSDHDNRLVVRWITREHGLPLFGPPTNQLIDPVVPEALKTESHATLYRAGTALLADPDGLNNGWLQPYAALNIARMLSTLETGTIQSKRVGVEWARSHLDARWTPLLERAWARHPGQSLRYQQLADPTDLQLTKEFIQYALDLKPLPGTD